jgi:hypothetical protein
MNTGGDEGKKFLVGKKPVRTPKHRWMDNITIDLVDIR